MDQSLNVLFESSLVRADRLSNLEGAAPASWPWVRSGVVETEERSTELALTVKGSWAGEEWERERHCCRMVVVERSSAEVEAKEEKGVCGRCRGRDMVVGEGGASIGGRVRMEWERKWSDDGWIAALGVGS